MFLNNRKIRQQLYQLIVALCFVCICFFAINNAYINLHKQGIATGFAFLSKSAGFDVIMHLIPFNEKSTYSITLILAILNTILVSACGITLATILGFSLGIARLSVNFIIRSIATIYVEFFRNIPLLLQIFCWYFGILRLLPKPKNSISLLPETYLNIRGLYFPNFTITENGFIFFIILATSIFFCALTYRYNKILGNNRHIRIKRLILLLCPAIFFIVLSPNILTSTAPVLRGFNYQGGTVIIPEFIALLLALSTYTAAFIAEIVRAGIEAIDKGQKEASLALGFHAEDGIRDIVLPQAMRIIIPPLTNQYLNLTKNSSLGAAIAYPELISVFAGTVLNQTGQAIEVIGITMAVYLILSLSVAMIMNKFNNAVAIKEN